MPPIMPPSETRTQLSFTQRPALQDSTKMIGDSTTAPMTRDQKRAHFAPLMALNKRHKRIKKEPVVELVGALGDKAIAGVIKNGVYNRGKDINGEDDENGIWSADKKQDFIVRVISGTAPLTFLFRESDDDEETDEEQHLQTYDGANRILAIAEFLSDKLRIRYNDVTFLYSELPDTTKNAFRNQKCISLTMSDCPEDFATQYAADLNHGTPMSMGEHLNLLRTQTFPRAVTSTSTPNSTPGPLEGGSDIVRVASNSSLS